MLTLLLSFLSLEAMEPLVKQTNTVKIQPKDSNKSVEVELHLARLSKTLTYLIEEAGTEQVIPLPNITLRTWNFIQQQFQSIYLLQIEPNNLKTKEALASIICALNMKDSVALLEATNYLAITTLYNLIIETYDLLKLPKEVFFSLPLDLIRPHIISAVHTKLPPSTDKKRTICYGHTRGVTSVCVTNDKIISGSEDGTVRVWDILTGKQIAICEGHAGAVASVCVSNDKIISGSSDGTIRIWDILTGKQIAIYEGHAGGVTSVCATDDKIISGSSDGTIRVWDILTGKQIAICIIDIKYRRGINSVCVTGNKIISGSEDDTVRVWDILTGEPIAIYKGHFKSVTSVYAIGDKIISGSNDSTVRVWDILTGKQIAIYKGHTNRVTSVFVSGGKIISSSADSTIHVRDLLTGNLISICKGDAGRIYSVCMTGDKVISGCQIESLFYLGLGIFYTNVIRIRDIAVLNRLHTMNRKQSEEIYDYLYGLQEITKDSDHWQIIKTILNVSDESGWCLIS